MKKSEILEHWEHLEAGQPIVPTPIPYKHKGTTFGMDNVRITGSQSFIDAWLSQNKWLLDYEDTDTRLQLNYQPCLDKETGEPLGGWSFYVSVRERGKGR